MKEKVVFRGKTFVSVKNSTVEHDFALMGDIRAAGLDRVHKLKGESVDEFARRLLFELIQSGKIFPILGGLLIPEEIPSEHWTPETGRETADWLRGVTDPEEKKAIQATVVSALISFFANGLVSVLTSPSYSEEEARGEPGPAATEES